MLMDCFLFEQLENPKEPLGQTTDFAHCLNDQKGRGERCWSCLTSTIQGSICVSQLEPKWSITCSLDSVPSRSDS
jgi:hypothetical protein